MVTAASTPASCHCMPTHPPNRLPACLPCSQGALSALAKEGMMLQFTEQFQAEGGEAPLLLLPLPAHALPCLMPGAVWPLPTFL